MHDLVRCQRPEEQDEQTEQDKTSTHVRLATLEERFARHEVMMDGRLDQLDSRLDNRMSQLDSKVGRVEKLLECALERLGVLGGRKNTVEP